ncbi:hypothetical protein [Olsenella uli]|uniref:hypothetical protein n=1 Tax=Olsenella uli TaxID=133926 RepID=UPI0012ABE43C|nr:hypothetical protein [Olsenella uli]
MADETKKVSQRGFYARPAAAGTEDCPQCFYTPSAQALEKDKEQQASEAGDCPQCYYTSEATKADERAQRAEAADCPQCFYTPSGESK